MDARNEKVKARCAKLHNRRVQVSYHPDENGFILHYRKLIDRKSRDIQHTKIKLSPEALSLTFYCFLDLVTNDCTDNLDQEWWDWHNRDSM